MVKTLMGATITPLAVESRVTADAHAAFLTFVAHSVQPFLKADPELKLPQWLREIKCSMFLMQRRNDGFTGFFGGSLDPGESRLEAVLREAKQEIGFAPQPDDLEAVSSHLITYENGTTRSAHLYGQEVEFERLQEILRFAIGHMQVDFWETHGAFLVPALCIPGTPYCLPAVMASPMPVSAAEQILTLLNHYDLILPKEEHYLAQIAAQRVPIPVFPG